MRAMVAAAFGLLIVGIVCGVLLFVFTEGRLPGAGVSAGDGVPSVPADDERGEGTARNPAAPSDDRIGRARAGGPGTGSGLSRGADAADRWSSGAEDSKGLTKPSLADTGAEPALEQQLGAGAVIAGRVLDDRGRPVGGARVSALAVDDATATIGDSLTEPDGSFFLRGLAQGKKYRLAAHKQGFLAMDPIALDGAETAPGGQLMITLVRAARLSGRVLTPGGRPANDAAVRLIRQGPVQTVRSRGARSTEQGLFDIGGIVPGSYKLFADHPQYGASVPLDLTVVPGASRAGIELALLRLAFSGKIEGQVVSEAGEPIAEATVSGYAETGSPGGITETPIAVTDDDGSFVLKGVGRSRYTLAAEAPGYVGSGMARLTGAQPVEASAGEYVVVTLSSGATIGGRVVDSEADPVTNFEVNVLARLAEMKGIEVSCRRASVSSAEGRFEIGGLIDDAIAVEVSATGFATARTMLPYFVPDTHNDIGMVTLTTGATISGVVRTRRGEPIPEAVVRLDASGPGLRPIPEGAEALWQPPAVTTRHDGTFELKHVSRGKHSLSAVHPQYAAARKSIDVPEDGVLADLELVLSGGGVISGAVYDSAGRRVPGVSIDVFPKDAAPPFDESRAKQAVTDPEGSYRLGGLSAGRYSVNASFGQGTAGGMQRTKTVNLPEGGEVACDFVEEVPCRLYGRVLGYRDEGDGTLAMLSLSAVSGESRTSTRIQPDGGYSFEPMPPGDYLIRFGTLGFPVTLPPTSEYPHDIELPAASISGRVVGSSGEPLSMVDVFARGRNPAAGDSYLARATSGSNGQFSLRNLTHGTYDITAESESHGTGSVTGIDVEGGTDVIGIDIVVEQTAGELVVAVYGPGGQLEPQAFVMCQDERGNAVGSGGVRLNEQRETVLSGLPPGTYRVVGCVGGEGCAWRDGVTVERGVDRRAEITLPDRRGRIRVQVTQGGSPAPDAGVSLVDATGRAVPDGDGLAGARGGRTDNDGFYHSGFFPAGAYTLRIDTGSAGAVEQSVTIPGDGSTLEISIRL